MKKPCYNCGGKGYTTEYRYRVLDMDWISSLQIPKEVLKGEKDITAQGIKKNICLYCQITCYKCGAVKGTQKCKYKKHVWRKLLKVPRVIPNKMK